MQRTALTGIGVVLALLFASYAVFNSFHQQPRYSGNVFEFKWAIFGQISESSTNQKPNQNMPPIWDIVLRFLPPIIAAVIALWLFNKKRTTDARDAFHTVLNLKEAEIPPIDHPISWDAFTFYKESIPEIRNAIAKVSPFTSEDERRAIGQIWKEYNNPTTRKELQPGCEGMGARSEAQIEEGRSIPVHDEERLLAFMQSFKKAVAFQKVGFLK